MASIQNGNWHYKRACSQLMNEGRNPLFFKKVYLEVKMHKHHLTHAEEAKGGHHSHMHHKKMHDHHLKEAKKHAHHMLQAAKASHTKHSTKAHHKGK